MGDVKEEDKKTKEQVKTTDKHSLLDKGVETIPNVQSEKK